MRDDFGSHEAIDLVADGPPARRLRAERRVVSLGPYSVVIYSRED